MPSKTPATNATSLLLAGLNRALELVESQITQQRATLPSVTPGMVRGEPTGTAYRLDDLEIFAQRLRQIKQWLEQDQDLITVVDNHISQQARKVERRMARQNTRLAITTTLVGALLGWLLSTAATPAQMIHALFH